jgi:hypothetical protein
MNKTLIALIIVLFGCQPVGKELANTASFQEFVFLRWMNFRELPTHSPTTIMHIFKNDSIEVVSYTYYFEGHKFKVKPSLYVGKIGIQKRKNLSKLIARSELSTNLEKFKNCRVFAYDISISFTDTVIKAECLDSSLFDNNMRLLIKFSNELSDTLGLVRIDYFNYFNKKGYVLPPLPLKGFEEIRE